MLLSPHVDLSGDLAHCILGLGVVSAVLWQKSDRRRTPARRGGVSRMPHVRNASCARTAAAILRSSQLMATERVSPRGAILWWLGLSLSGWALLASPLVVLGALR